MNLSDIKANEWTTQNLSNELKDKLIEFLISCRLKLAYYSIALNCVITVKIRGGPYICSVLILDYIHIKQNTKTYLKTNEYTLVYSKYVNQTPVRS